MLSTILMEKGLTFNLKNIYIYSISNIEFLIFLSHMRGINLVL